MQTSGTRPAGRDPLPLRAIALAAVAVSLAALAGTWAWGRLHPGIPDAGGPVGGDRAEVIVRHVEVAFADTQAVWARQAAGYDMAPLVFFTNRTESPCAGGAAVSGPFYCPETGTAAFDLGFLDLLAARLGRQRDLGLAIVAARVSAEHLQRELGLMDRAALQLIGSRRAQRGALGSAMALQADCLTGVWARAAEPRIGPVPATLYGELVWSWRNVADDLARSGRRLEPAFDPFAAAAQSDRAAAFAQGYASGALGGCPAPAELRRG